MKFSRLVGVLGFCLAGGLGQAQGLRPEPAMQVHEVRSGIYMLEGRGGNIGVSTGPDGVLLIDDQFAPRHEKLVAAVATVSSEPVRYVINSHWHFDHTDGNELLGAKGAVIVAQDNTRERQKTEQRIDTFKVVQPARNAAGQPKLTFRREMTFHWNGQTIDLVHPGAAHTDGDTLIFFKEANVIHTGDVFVRYGLPFIDSPHGGSIDGMIAACEVILARCDDETIIIPGHGALAKKADVAEYQTMLREIRDAIAPLVAANKTLAEIIQANPLGAHAAKGKSIKPEVFIGLVVESLAGKR